MEQILTLLQQAADYEIGYREKTPLSKTIRTCRQLFKFESAMWLFVTVEDVEPTNNAAERAIRPAVLVSQGVAGVPPVVATGEPEGRRTSFGSQTEAGSNFVARMLTVVTTLKCQNRNVLEFMTFAVVAARSAETAPSLLPQVVSDDDCDLLNAA